MSEPKEIHRIRARLTRAHPEWSVEQVRMEMEKSMKVHTSSQKVHKGSQEINLAPSNPLSQTSSQKVHKGSQRIFVKVDHSVRKGQYIVSESMDGIFYRYVATIRKGQAFERNGVVIVPTWHRGDGREHGDIPPNEAKEAIEKPWNREALK